MKGFVRLMAVVVTAAAFAVACSKDKDSGKITLDSPAVFFAQAGGSATVGFTAQNIKTMSATSKPTGWDEAVVDLAGATISVKAPSAEDIESGMPSRPARSPLRVTPRAVRSFRRRSSPVS